MSNGPVLVPSPPPPRARCSRGDTAPAPGSDKIKKRENMEDKYFYSTNVEWTGARHGALKSDSLPTLQVDAPPEFKGNEGAWTPEHLFVGAISSCFMTTFIAIAENSKLDFE